MGVSDTLMGQRNQHSCLANASLESRFMAFRQQKIDPHHLILEDGVRPILRVETCLAMLDANSPGPVPALVRELVGAKLDGP